MNRGAGLARLTGHVLQPLMHSHWPIFVCEAFDQLTEMPGLFPHAQLQIRLRCSSFRTVTMSSSRLGRLKAKHSALLVCDVQERFRSVVQQFEAVVDTSKRMVKGAELLQIPVVVTEQYPQALVSVFAFCMLPCADLAFQASVIAPAAYLCVVCQGATVQELKSVLPAGTAPVAKTDFSMCVAEVKQELAKHPDIHQVCSMCSSQLGGARTGSA